MQPIVNDFFCGCGGMGVGFLNAGYKIAGAWDFDKYAVQSYDHNVGHHVKQADIKEMTWQDVPFAHVWAFGFPCQDLSVAGKQAGLLLKCQDCDSDFAIDPSNFTGQTTCPNCGSKNYKAASRSGCFYEIMRLIDETREHAPNSLPAVLVAENVKGLTPYIPVLTAELKQRGYIAHVKLYNSKFWNVAQNRERYYIAATRDDLQDVLQMPEQNENPELVPRLSDFLDKDVPERFYVPEEKARKIIEQALLKLSELGKVHATITPDRLQKRQNGPRAKKDEEPMFTLTAQDLHGAIIQTEENDNNGIIVSDTCNESELPEPIPEHLCAGITNNSETAKAMTDTLFTDKDDCAYCCQANYYKGLSPSKIGKGQRTHIIEYKEDNKKGYIPEEIAHTLTTLDVKRYRVRKLTPTEYGRLQAFPMDNWEQVVSDSQAYKQFGNAVTTTVATGVAESITDFLSHVGILKEDTTMEEMNKATSTQAQTENPAIAQITAILQPKKERLTELMNEESQLRTEVEALELAISTIQNGGKENA